MGKKKRGPPLNQESVEEFLARGGAIKFVPTGVSAIDPLGPRNRNIRISDKPSSFVAYEKGGVDGAKAR